MKPDSEPITDPEKYAVYAALLPSVWPSVSEDAVLLQQETEDIAAASTHSSSGHSD
jgi:hypothetical protein